MEQLTDREITSDIIHGDCIDVLSEMEANTVDLVVTSPPYNVNIDYGKYNDDILEIDYYSFLSDVFDELNRVVSDGGRVCVNISLKNDAGIIDHPRTVKELAEKLGWHLRFEIIWNKGNSESSSAWGSWRSPSSPRPIFNHEYVFVFDVRRPKEKSEKTIEKERFMKLVKSVWNIKPETQSDHPAAFPLELPRRLIELNSYPDDVVLDPFAGSGTTLVAAAELDRKYIGVEMEEEYVTMAQERIVDYDPDARQRGLFDF